MGKCHFDFDTDMERMNFLTWYQGATQADIELARKNNSEKLNELLDKYKYDIAFVCGIGGHGGHKDLGHFGCDGKYRFGVCRER